MDDDHCGQEPALLPAPPRAAIHRQPDWYIERREALFNRLPEAMEAAHGAFTGPSLDFPQWAADARASAVDGAPQRDVFLRAVYGTLVAWGMHRMGQTGARMPRYDVFRGSVEAAWPWVLELWETGRPQTQAHWSALCRVFHRIRASTTNSHLVAKAKVLALLLPGSCAVIDGRHTLRFLGLYGSYVRAGRDGDFEWRLYREIHELFFYPLIGDQRFPHCQDWPPAGAAGEQAMIGTPLRRADSLVVGFQRSLRPAEA